MRAPFTRQSTYQRLVERFNALAGRFDKQGENYSILWADHLSRCDCHDAWGQCEHAASGQHTEGCGCCRWCGSAR